MAKKEKKKVEKKEDKFVTLEDKTFLMLPLGPLKMPTKEGAEVSISLKGSVTLSTKGTSYSGHRLICVKIKEAALL